MTAQQTVPTTATGSHVLEDGFFADRSFDYGIRIALGATAYGVGDVGTVLATAARITDGDWASWFSAWTDRADQLAALAAQHRQAGDLRGASWAFLSAADAWSRSLDAIDGLPAERPRPSCCRRSARAATAGRRGSTARAPGSCGSTSRTRTPPCPGTCYGPTPPVGRGRPW